MRRHLRAALVLTAILPAALLTAADPEPLPLPLPPAPGAGGARVANPDEARTRLGLLPDYALGAGLKNVKVAVLDSGFAGIDGKRAYLPADAVLVEHYDPDFVRKFGLGDPEFKKPFRPGDSHGRLLAQIVWSATGNFPDGPKFYLLNSNGPTLFRRAVRYAIEQKVDVILFAGTFEGAGNYDGRGPINAMVDDAVAAGIIWVNAAGNTGGMVFNGPVDVGPGGYVRFAAAGLTALRLKSRLDENAATLTLTWNDYREAEDAGTEKDLDLIVEDSAGRVVGESKLKQVGAGVVAGEGQTKNPRERLTLTDLATTDAGKEYRVRVKANSANFGPRDRLRILLTPGRPPVNDATTKRAEPSTELLDATRGGEIYPPADHAGVLTVGEPGVSSAIGPTSDGRVKPDVIVAESVVKFTNGDETSGASNAAAYFAGVAAVLRATEPRLTAGDLRTWVRTLDAAARPAAPVAGVVPAAPVPAAPAVALTPNQLRALRFSEYALDEKRRRGDPNPSVIISSGAGEWVVRPGGVVGTPAPAPAVVPAKPAARVEAVHAPWLTPTPRQLADLIRGSP